MPRLGLSTTKAGGIVSSYERDGLKLYMPYNSPKEVKFVGEGSTAFITNDKVTISDASSLSFTTGGLTVMAWVKMTDATNFPIISKGIYNTSGEWWFITQAADKLHFNLFDESVASCYIGQRSTSAITAYEGEWVHVVGTYDGNATSSGVILYLNGTVLPSDTFENNAGSFVAMENLAADVIIGEYNTNFANGSMKNVAIWNRTLSPTEIQNVMYKTYIDLSGTLTSGLVSWWALESSEDTYADSTGTNDGTNSGSTVNSSLYGGATPLIPRGFDNAPTVQADAIGTGFASFNGDNDNISLTEFVLDTNGNCTILFWAKRTATGEDAILGHTSTSSYKVIRFSSGHDLALESDTNTDIATVTLHTEDINVWHHYALVCTSGTLTAYQDGISCSVANAGMSDDTTINRIGGNSTDGESKNYEGYLKNIGTWSGALTQAQIQSIMEKTYSELNADEKEDLVSWWGLDSYLGDNTHSDGKMIQDEHNTTLGSEIIDADSQSGTITDSSTPWVSDGDGSGGEAQQATISSGTITWTSVGDQEALSYTGTPVVGTTYKCVLTVSLTSGSFGVYSDRSTDLAHLTITSSGTYTAYIIHEQTNWMVRFASNSFIGTISDISLKVVTDANTGQLK